MTDKEWNDLLDKYETYETPSLTGKEITMIIIGSLIITLISTIPFFLY
jgi:hypothetical protein